MSISGKKATKEIAAECPFNSVLLSSDIRNALTPILSAAESLNDQEALNDLVGGVNQLLELARFLNPKGRG